MNASRAIVLALGGILVCMWGHCDAGFARVNGRHIVDSHGRAILLQGVNIGFSCKVEEGGKARVIWEHGGADDFERIREWGFNCVRIPLFWAALEPECGVHDDAFLSGLDEKIAWAKQSGLHVILDMHQDMWGLGVPEGRGAPEWALLDKEKPHVKEGPKWVTCFQSLRVRTAFDDFWRNSPGPDGTGLQDRFALAWQHVAKRYAGEPAVIGYDVFNEPFPGSQTFSFMMAMLSTMSENMAARGVQLDDLSLTERGALAWDEAHSSVDAYAKWMDQNRAVVERFNTTTLGPMYNRVAKAIRAVDPNHLIFTASSMLGNVGAENGFPRILDDTGRQDSLQVFAPHAYDHDRERLEFIVQRLLETARRLDAPMVMTEWGNLGNADGMYDRDPVPAAAVVVTMLEQAQAGKAYWYYDKALDKAAYFAIIQRPYPRAVSGVPVRYGFDPATRLFECVWKEDPAISAPTQVFVPGLHYPDGYVCEVQPPGKEPGFATVADGSSNGVLSVAPTGEAVERKLMLRPKTGN